MNKNLQCRRRHLAPGRLAVRRTLSHQCLSSVILTSSLMFSLVHSAVSSIHNNNKYASCPDWRISPHADRRHHKRLQHWPSPSKRRHVSHMVCDDRACLSRGLTSVERVIDFSIFDPGGLPWAKGHQKVRWPAIHLDLPSHKISARSRKRCSKYGLPTFFSLFRWSLTPHGHRVSYV